MINKQYILEELICIHPFSSFEIIAGEKNLGITFTRVIEGINEIKGDELLLIRVDHLQDNLLETLKKAINMQVSAIFLMGNEENLTYHLFHYLQNDSQIPILLYKKSISIVQIENTLQLIDQLKSLNQFSNFVVNSISHIINEVNQIGIQKFMSQLERKINRKIIITDIYLNELIERKEQNYFRNSFKSSFKSKVNELEYTNSQFTKIDFGEDGTYYIRPFSYDKMKSGYILINGGAVTAFASFQIDSLMPVLIAELKKRNEFLEFEKKYQKNFIYDLVHNNFDSPYTIINEARYWGWDMSSPHLLILMELRNSQGDMLEDELIELAEKLIENSLRSLFYKPIVMELNGLFIILVNVARGKQEEEIKKESKLISNTLTTIFLEHKVDFCPRLGIGRYYPSIVDICRSYQEAKLALEFGRYDSNHSLFTHFDDLGLMRLLINIREEQLKEYYNEYLGELDKYDKLNEADMLITLQVFLEEDRNLKSTADKLFIHINTLRNRLKKIESILNINLEKSVDLLNLLVALKIKTMNVR